MSLCDPLVFKSVFEELNTAVQRFLLSKGISLEDAVDHTQESFLKLWKNCSSVPREKAKSYLYKVGNNLIIDGYRRTKTSLQWKSRQKERVEKIDGQYELEMSEFKNRLQDAIDTMSRGSREVFMMSRFNDMKYSEIAAALDISVKAVEKRMHGALKHLHDKSILKKG